MNLDQLKNGANSVEDYVLEVRRWLHAHPETRWEEEETLAYISQQIDNICFGVNNEPKVGLIRKRTFDGGLIVDLTIDDSFDRLIFRADVDALPIQEDTGLEFASQVDGKMHACGHDVHPAILLGAIKAIMDGSIALTHNIRFVFQRAEENPGTAPNPKTGGKTLVDEGVCDGISAAHALHISTMSGKSTSGVIFCCPGQALANSDRLQIKVTCTGGHVAMPHNGSNAVVIANQIITTTNGYVSRTLDPYEMAVVEPTILNTGTASNIRPATADLWFGVRTFLPKGEREAYMRKLILFIKQSVECYDDVTIEENPVWGHPMTSNNEDQVASKKSLFESAGLTVEFHKPLMGGEDFGYYLREVPGVMWMLGAGGNDSTDHHTPTFNPDETVLKRGVLFWLVLATE